MKNPIFNLYSNLRNKTINKLINKSKQELDELSELLNTTAEDEIDVLSDAMYLFSVGCVFDDEDKYFMDEMIEYFSSPGLHFNNQYKLLKYTTETIRQLEIQSSLEHGNYHMALFIVTTDETLHSYYVGNEDVSNFMTQTLNRYGISELNTFTSPKSNQFKYSGDVDEIQFPQFINRSKVLKHNANSKSLLSRINEDKIPIENEWE